MPFGFQWTPASQNNNNGPKVKFDHALLKRHLQSSGVLEAVRAEPAAGRPGAGGDGGGPADGGAGGGIEGGDVGMEDAATA
jgi:hypothetical protein